MSSRAVKSVTIQCAEIEDLLNLLGIDARVFRIVNPGAVEQLVQNLRKDFNERVR